MLRITIRVDEHGTAMELAGRLAGPWVQELARCWEEAAAVERKLSVMLLEVTYIDAAGRGLLAEMHRRGTEIEASGCLNKAIVEQIKKRKAR
ncbi:MAG TPA: hypothetical protein VNN77_01515 [candidate division Zixibacteria bacterium]|nr:hypothetical protein [candidate division Zixibacteria bacterium]